VTMVRAPLLLLFFIHSASSAGKFRRSALSASLFPLPSAPSAFALPLSLSPRTIQSLCSQHVNVEAPPTVETPTVASEAPPRQRSGFISGPSEPAPDYSKIHGPLGPVADEIFLRVFRSRFARRLGCDSALPQNDYTGLMELTSALNARYSDRLEVRRAAREILISLFPSWLPALFPILFAKPFPVFSARMNAWATWVAGTWLMGECEVVDCDVDGGGTGEAQGLLVKRCRFLEESGCASVCVNACKVPTQEFFIQNMGLPLTMEPDYETGECMFSFGLTPSAAMEAEAEAVPCLARCPSAGGMKAWHDGTDGLDEVQCQSMGVVGEEIDSSKE